MARRTLQQADAEVDWDFSESALKIVRSVSHEARFKNSRHGSLVTAEDTEQELLLWLSLRKKARDRWEKEGLLYRNISREAQNIANRAGELREHERLLGESYWTHGESGEEEWD